MRRLKKGITPNIPVSFMTFLGRKILRLDQLFNLMNRQAYSSTLRTCISRIPLARPLFYLVYYLLLNAMIVWPKGQSLWLVKLPSGPRWLTPDLSDAIDHITVIWRRVIYDRLRLSEGQVVIDAGAHIGIYAVKASKALGGRGLVVAIEPHPQNFKCLARNLELNKCKNVVPINAALFSHSGEGTLFVDKQSVGHSIVIERSNSGIKINMVTLDELTNELGISHIDHMKVDVEGATIAALNGSENVISTYKPKIIVEVGHYPSEASETIIFLSHYGYTTHVDSEIMYAEMKGE